MNLDRRTVLIGGGAGVGLIVAFALWPRHLSSDLAIEAGEQAFGNFIKIAREGRITVAVPQAETGQGIWTALPQIVADELGAAWETVAVEPAPLIDCLCQSAGDRDGLARRRRLVVAPRNRKRRTRRITADRPRSAPSRQPMRHAAAIARAMLVGAAADRWNVAPAECETGDGFVINGGRTFTFGELAEEAADRSPPSHAPLRDSAKGRLVGQPLIGSTDRRRRDGSWRFAGDVRLARHAVRSGSGRAAGRTPCGIFARRGEERARRAPRRRARRLDRRRGRKLVGRPSARIKAANPVFSGSRSPSDMRGLFEQALAERHGAERCGEAIMSSPSKDRVRSPRLIMSRRARISGSSR